MKAKHEKIGGENRNVGINPVPKFSKHKEEDKK